MSEPEKNPDVDALKVLAAALAEQRGNPLNAVVPMVRVRQVKGVGLELLHEGSWVPITIEQAGLLLQKRAETIHLMETDPLQHGYVPPAWDEILWEICKLRVRNPGIVIQPAVFGANGSGKTFFAEWFMMHFLVDSKKVTAWSFSLDEPNSEAVNQKWAHWYAPPSYHTEKGSVKRTVHTKYNYNDAGGYTDNKFSFQNGCTCEFRFYTKDISSNEGVRPAFAWMDEEFPDPWLDAVERRLLTLAGRTWEHIAMWKTLLEQKKANPDMRFPRDKIHLLALGVQLVTFTAKKGYTPTVRAFVKGATVVKELDAILLPKKNAAGEVAGYEKVPKLLYCSNPKRIVIYLHAWDNPIGGNWAGMQEMAKSKSRKEILWWCYGVAEETSGVVCVKFSHAAHVRPLAWLPRKGTWYHIADPCGGKRNWCMKWVKVNEMGLGFRAWEWPMEKDFIPGIGFVGPWALPSTGSRQDGDPGPAQPTFGKGFQFVADEIARVERGLYWVEQQIEKHGRELTREQLIPPVLSNDAPRIVVAERYMDSRAANTETMTHGASETLIEVMRKRYQLRFTPVDKDHGAQEGSRQDVKQGMKFVEDALDFDEELAVLNEETGFYEFNGKAPKIMIAENCTNAIFAYENWTGLDGGEGACKDPMDTERYGEMMGMRYRRTREEREEAGEDGGWGGY